MRVAAKNERSRLLPDPRVDLLIGRGTQAPIICCLKKTSCIVTRNAMHRKDVSTRTKYPREASDQFELLLLECVDGELIGQRHMGHAGSHDPLMIAAKMYNRMAEEKLGGLTWGHGAREAVTEINDKIGGLCFDRRDNPFERSHISMQIGKKSDTHHVSFRIQAVLVLPHWHPTSQRIVSRQVGRQAMTESARPAKNQAEPPCYSFEEFRMMYDSTELISERKIAFNRNNASLCLLVIAGQGAAASWLYKEKGLALLGPVALITISILAIIFCLYWNGQLWAFKELNSAKFQVLEEMADRVAFPDYRERSIVSMNPFMREYQILTENKKLVAGAKGLLLQRSNFAETIVPKSFIAFFAAVTFLSIIWLLMNFGILGKP